MRKRKHTHTHDLVGDENDSDDGARQHAMTDLHSRVSSPVGTEVKTVKIVLQRSREVHLQNISHPGCHVAIQVNNQKLSGLVLFPWCVRRVRWRGRLRREGQGAVGDIQLVDMQGDVVGRQQALYHDAHVSAKRELSGVTRIHQRLKFKIIVHRL